MIILKIIAKALRQVKRIPFWYKSIFLQKCYFFSKEKYWPNENSPIHIKEVIFPNRICSNEDFINYIDKQNVKTIIDEVNKNSGTNIKYAKQILVWNNINEVDLGSISTTCFIKGTHGCGMNMCYDPNKTDSKKSLMEIEKWLGIEYYKIDGEMNYKGLKPKILVEELLFDESKSSLYDVKIHCIEGEPIAIQILFNDVNLKRKTYDKNWKEKNWFENECLDIEISDNLKRKIIDYSRILSVKFKYVRIDFFLVSEKDLYFAEFTFTPAGGHMPFVNKEVDKKLFQLSGLQNNE